MKNRTERAEEQEPPENQTDEAVLRGVVERMGPAAVRLALGRLAKDSRGADERNTLGDRDYHSYLLKTEQKDDDFFASQPEKCFSAKIDKLHKLQADVRMAPSKTKARLIRNTSQAFLDILLSKDVEEQKNEVIIAEEGIDLILNGLPRVQKPDLADSIEKIIPIFKAQEIRTLDNSQGINDTRFRYQAKHGQRFGPYENKEEDRIAKLVEILNPEYWMLREDKKAYYEDVVKLKKIVYENPEFRPVHIRKSTSFIRKHREYKRRQKYEQTQQKYEQTPEEEKKAHLRDIEVSKQITATWQRTSVDKISERVKISQSIENEMLEQAKQEAALQLKADEELARLKKRIK